MIELEPQPGNGFLCEDGFFCHELEAVGEGKRCHFKPVRSWRKPSLSAEMKHINGRWVWVDQDDEGEA